eukprot:gnl/Chilomastix_caulleri/268.p1 GENE.gnl/Chilomastix_caulleri/268~~gnl/Chilomastix_caulleri/268.p1  ORF type:complete len:146 (+),score=25.34 gnl/Chilomastix_caulleri/268:38-439(+)
MLAALLALVSAVFSRNVLSECTVYNLAKSEFGSGQIAHTMTCIAKYESSFDADAVNHNTNGSSDYGLYQCNDRYWCYSSYTPGKADCNVNCEQLFDPATATRCAHTVYKQQGLTAWVAYNSHKSTCDNYHAPC